MISAFKADTGYVILICERQDMIGLCTVPAGAPKHLNTCSVAAVNFQWDLFRGSSDILSSFIAVTQALQLKRSM
jgi:hypothetical protein